MSDGNFRAKNSSISFFICIFVRFFKTENIKNKNKLK